MSDLSTTCWTAVRAAASGDAAERARFVERYADVVRAYLATRRAGQWWPTDADDAVQEVFFECFKAGGALEAAIPGRPGGFRAFLLGVAAKVAARDEERRARRREVALPEDSNPPAELASHEQAEAAFDRAWARALMGQAAQAQRRRAETHGGPLLRQVEILELRFGEDLPIREIARRLGRDAAEVHRDYGRARREFLLALRQVVLYHLPGAERNVDAECRRLLDLLKAP